MSGVAVVASAAHLARKTLTHGERLLYRPFNLQVYDLNKDWFIYCKMSR